MNRSQISQFLLGVGGQKCGTTWLYRQLMQQPWFAPGDRKEYRLFERSSPSLEDYAFHFRHCLQIRPGTSVCADITPAYALLETAELSKIQHALEQEHFRVRALFVVRDPLERLWSQVRMHRIKGNVKGHAPYQSDTEGIRDMLHRAGAEGRTRYHYTVKRLQQVFTPVDLHITIYEQMFQPLFAEELEQWLGLPIEALHPQERINSSPKQSVLSEDIQVEVVNHFADVYTWAEGHFGPGIRQLWGGYRLLK